ncbi:MAG TPA: hypothetical protein PKZ42_04950 [Syntrophales bacterium]|nr:hypothetical protein [Syntrophales bacterium]
MALKHNLEFQGTSSPSVHEDQHHTGIYKINPFRTYADIIEKKKEILTNKILQIFPGSHVLSEDEVKELYASLASGSAKPERAGRESARASGHTAKDTIKDKRNSKRIRENRRNDSGQVALELLSSNGGAI